MKKKAWIPEWSKGSDLSSDAVSFVGSNPTSCIFSHLNSKLQYIYSSRSRVRVPSGGDLLLERTVNVSQLAQSVEQLPLNLVNDENSSLSSVG